MRNVGVPEIKIERTESAVSSIVEAMKPALRSALVAAVVNDEVVSGGGDGEAGFEVREPFYDEIIDRMFNVLNESGALEASARMALGVPTCSPEDRAAIRALWLDNRQMYDVDYLALLWRLDPDEVRRIVLEVEAHDLVSREDALICAGAYLFSPAQVEDALGESAGEVLPSDRRTRLLTVRVTKHAADAVAARHETASVAEASHLRVGVYERDSSADATAQRVIEDSISDVEEPPFEVSRENASIS